jgi:uncharacterized protein YutE (UPF0331/DUF86 family)
VVRPEVIRRRLQKLEEYLAVLERLRARYDRQAFLADPERYGAAERFLQLAVETVIDIGAHIVADERLGVIEEGRDIPRIFRERGFIDSDLEGRWVATIGFRNILVHDYLGVNRDIVFTALQERLGDFRALEQVFARFL